MKNFEKYFMTINMGLKYFMTPEKPSGSISSILIVRPLTENDSHYPVENFNQHWSHHSYHWHHLRFFTTFTFGNVLKLLFDDFFHIPFEIIF